MSKRNEVVEKMAQSEGVTISQLAALIGKPSANLYDIQSGKLKGVSEKLADLIISKFPHYNKSWLLTGEGEMLNTANSGLSPQTPSLEAVLIPLLPVSAQGGSLNDFVISVRESDCEKVVSPVKGADFAMYVAGDSMSPEYPNGSQVHVKKIHEDAFIEWGKVYVLDTCNGAVIKRIIPSEKDGYIKCMSINPNPIYAPFDVNMNDIYGVYRVMLCLSIK